MPLLELNPAPSGGTATQEPFYTCNSVQVTGTLATDTVRCEAEIRTLAQVSNGEIVSPSRMLHYTDRAERIALRLPVGFGAVGIFCFDITIRQVQNFDIPRVDDAKGVNSLRT